jgi:hypothetical protein
MVKKVSHTHQARAICKQPPNFVRTVINCSGRKVLTNKITDNAEVLG